MSNNFQKILIFVAERPRRHGTCDGICQGGFCNGSRLHYDFPQHATTDDLAFDRQHIVMRHVIERPLSEFLDALTIDKVVVITAVGFLASGGIAIMVSQAEALKFYMICLRCSAHWCNHDQSISNHLHRLLFPIYVQQEAKTWADCVSSPCCHQISILCHLRLHPTLRPSFHELHIVQIQNHIQVWWLRFGRRHPANLRAIAFCENKRWNGQPASALWQYWKSCGWICSHGSYAFFHTRYRDCHAKSLWALLCWLAGDPCMACVLYTLRRQAWQIVKM